MTALKWGCKKTKKEIAQYEHENLIHHKGKENNSRRKLFFFQMIFFFKHVIKFMRMPHNETGEILLFKKPTVQLWLIFELTNMLSNTEGKKKYK